MSENAIYNKALNAYNVPRDVYQAIKSAASKTGVNFTYLMEKAAVESSFNKNAKAATSSATGLYQFIESTWLKMVKDHGADYGLEKYADKISDDGRVASRKDRREILALRKDPEISSIMAAKFDQENYEKLKTNVGGDIGSTELYMAHFLGAGGASSFLNAMKKSPNMVAADIFRDAARTNRGVFYDQRTGAPRSLAQVYAFFDNKFQGDETAQNIMTASNGGPINLRTNAYETGPRANQNTPLQDAQDPFTRLAALMGGANSGAAMAAQDMAFNDSVLRVNGDSRSSDQKDGAGWQIFPPSLYSRLSLSPAQMMMLSDFNA